MVGTSGVVLRQRSARDHPGCHFGTAQTRCRPRSVVRRLCHIVSCSPAVSDVASAPVLPTGRMDQTMAVDCNCRQDLARRGALAAALGCMILPTFAQSASADQGMSRYIRRRKLDPLDTYVPAVLEARGQLVEAGEIMGTDAKEARLLLRQRAFTGLRDNIKALGQYAGQSGVSSKEANELVANFFSAVEAYDFILFDAIRDEQPVPATAQDALQRSILALDRLVATVPEAIVEKSKAVVEAALQPSQMDSADQEAKSSTRIQELIPTL